MGRSAAVNWFRGWLRRSSFHAAAGALVVVGVGVGTTAFTAPAGANAPRLPVAIHVRSETAPVLAQALPGRFLMTSAPSATPDDAHVRSRDVDDARVVAEPLDPSIWFSMIAVLGALAIMLLGGGLVAFLYQARQARLPAEARWVPPGW
jgi:hypothetical protein